MSSERFIAALDDELVAAARRRTPERDGTEHPRRRHRRGTRAAVALAAAASLAVAFVALDAPDEVAADVEVIRRGDELLVRLSDVQTRPDEIERAARDAGLDVRVVSVPVGPSNVGRFAGASSSERVEDLHVVDGDPASGFNGFRVPVDFEGRIELLLGRPAQPGESWKLGSSSTSKGEPLDCEDVSGADVGDVLELAALHDVARVSVLVIDEPGGAKVHTDQLERFAGVPVYGVTNTDDTSIMIEAARDLSNLPEPPPPGRVGCD